VLVKQLRRQANACGSERADYLVVQGVARYRHAALAGELPKLAHGVAEGSHLHLGEAADLSHGDFSTSRGSGSSTHDHTHAVPMILGHPPGEDHIP
jgi:hypothetical protein